MRMEKGRKEVRVGRFLARSADGRYECKIIASQNVVSVGHQGAPHGKKLGSKTYEAVQGGRTLRCVEEVPGEKDTFKILDDPRYVRGVIVRRVAGG